ncbi:hypothetical protein GJAV_G00134300 [Gymnothorax javanicus]|nr:hypothetical protein GJAV_G00134300 [Gymnothorax javanicus]
MPLLESASTHPILEPHPEDQFSPNAYLFRSCPPPPQLPPTAAGRQLGPLSVGTVPRLWWSLWKLCPFLSALNMSAQPEMCVCPAFQN